MGHSRSLLLIVAVACGVPAIVGFGVDVRTWTRSSRVPRSVVSAGLFDGVKDAFAKPTAPTGEDRVTPIDRWLGIDKELTTPREVRTFVDPQDVANYQAVHLAKPMGIKFLENEGSSGGIVVDEILEDGSASATKANVERGDQLVAVGEGFVLDLDFDSALAAIQSSAEDQVRLIFFRGPEEFLYGPTRPSEEWLRDNLFQ